VQAEGCLILSNVFIIMESAGLLALAQKGVDRQAHGGNIHARDYENAAKQSSGSSNFSALQLAFGKRDYRQLQLGAFSEAGRRLCF
jgi:hypothetical protein